MKKSLGKSSGFLCSLVQYKVRLTAFHIEWKVGGWQHFLLVASEEGKQSKANSLQQKKQQEMKEMGPRDIRDMLQNRRSKKNGANKIIVPGWLAYIVRRSALCLPRVEKSKTFGFSRFFAGTNFSDCHLKEYFTGF